MAAKNTNLWTEFNGVGFSAKHSEYAERASNDVTGNDLTLTISDSKVTAIGGKPIAGVSQIHNEPITGENFATPVAKVNNVGIGAERSVADENGNNIVATYATKADVENAMGDIETLLAAL